MIVWLASYPRSGNTFFRVILNSVFDIKTYSIYDDKSDIGADEKTSEVVGHEFLPENFDIQKARDEEKIYYIKTHELYDNRVDEKDKVIYLIRDGRESILSYSIQQKNKGFQKTIIDTIYGNTVMSSIGYWGDHAKSWDPKNRENTLLIKFETLIKEPIKYIEILSHFLQTQPIGDKIPTFEELKKINPKFFRSGKTNSWEDIYSEEEHISFWLKNYKVMEVYGYDYKKPDILENLENNRFILESINQNNYLINLVLEKNKELQLAQKQKLINEKQKVIHQKNKELEEKQKVIHQKNKELEEKQQIIHKQLFELQAIYTSKKYKLANVIASPYILLKQLIRR